MAVAHPLVWRQQNFAAKTEATNGTAEALTAAEGKFNIVGDVTLEPDFPANERQSPGSFSQWTAVPGAAGANVDLTVEMANSGSATVPQWFSMLAACGFSISSGVATVASGSATAGSYTCGHYIDGWLWTAAGCMFNLEGLWESGKIPTLKYTGRGVHQAPTTTALITPTYETGTPPTFKGSTLTIAAATYVIPRVALNMGNDVQLREDGNSTNGYKAAVIVNRKPVWEIDIEADTAKNWYTEYTSRTESALSFAVGSGSNGVITWTSPKIQLIEPPKKVNRNGILVWGTRWSANKSAAAGDDEVVCTLS